MLEPRLAAAGAGPPSVLCETAGHGERSAQSVPVEGVPVEGVPVEGGRVGCGDRDLPPATRNVTGTRAVEASSTTAATKLLSANCDEILATIAEFYQQRAVQGPVTVQELRSNCWPDADDKRTVDAALIELARSGRLTLFRHDYPGSLSLEEREELIADDAGNFYNAVALKDFTRSGE
jgi:hypothetical protein